MPLERISTIISWEVARLGPNFFSEISLDCIHFATALSSKSVLSYKKMRQIIRMDGWGWTRARHARNRSDALSIGAK